MANADCEAGPQASRREKVFDQELVAAFANHIPLVLVGPVIAALAAFLLTSLLPSEYTSTSLVRMDRPTAKSMEALITTPVVAASVLSKYPETGNGREGHARFFSRKLDLVDTDPGVEWLGERLFRFEITHRDPRVAQAINSDLIDAWLLTTRPRPGERANLEAELERAKIAAAINTKLIEQLQSSLPAPTPTTLPSEIRTPQTEPRKGRTDHDRQAEMKSVQPQQTSPPDSDVARLLVQTNIAIELATAISALVDERDRNLATITAIEGKLMGKSRDYIVSPPHFPQEPKAPRNRAIALLSGIAAIPLLLSLIILGRYFAPGRSAREVISGWFSRTV